MEGLVVLGWTLGAFEHILAYHRPTRSSYEKFQSVRDEVNGYLFGWMFLIVELVGTEGGPSLSGLEEDAGMSLNLLLLMISMGHEGGQPH